MQLTLVSHYGAKPPEFAALIRELQGTLRVEFKDQFSPYTVEQVHGTIIGLEGVASHNEVLSQNVLQLRGEKRPFNFSLMLDYLRNEVGEFAVQVGGFQSDQDYRFTSQEKAPFLRSFSLHSTTAVAMGWPRDETGFPPTLDRLRRSLEPFGALRKWAWREGEVDNDFYFVLGQITGPIADALSQSIEVKARAQLSAKSHLLHVGNQTLSFVAYSDLRLPPETSRVLKLSDRATTAQSLAEVYFCNR